MPPAVIVAVPVPFVIVQVPPEGEPVNAGVCEFTQTDAAPPLTDGVGNAFTTVVIEPGVTEAQPLVLVYPTVTVLPALAVSR